MEKTVVKIRNFEVDDAVLSAPLAKGDNTLSIPCKSDPELCMQLDGMNIPVFQQR
jgi:Protein of unknown function (DUF1480)